MLHEDGEQGVAHPDALQPGGDLAGDLVQAFAAGGHLQAVRYYLHGFTGWETVLSPSRIRAGIGRTFAPRTLLPPRAARAWAALPHARPPCSVFSALSLRSLRLCVEQHACLVPASPGEGAVTCIPPQLPYPMLGYSARRAKEKTGWKSGPNTCHTTSRPIMLSTPNERPKF